MPSPTPISQLPGGALTGANTDVDNDKLAIDDVSAGVTKYITPKELVANSSAFLQSGTGAVSRTVQAKLREIEVSINDFSTIQAAIDAFKPASETTSFSTTIVIRIPDGDHEITSPINLYSGVKLRGTGEASKIVQGGGFSGTALVLLKGQGANAFCASSGAESIGFRCTGSVWAIKQNATTVANCSFKDIFLDAGFGLDFGTYAQGCVIDTIYAGGSNTNQILHLKGNQNIVRNIDKEGNTGSSTDPYILIESHSGGKSQGNWLDFILIEGGTSANKSAIKLLNCEETHLDHLWFEPTSSDGYGLRLSGCLSTRIGQFSNGMTTVSKLKVDTSQTTIIDYLDVSGAEQAPTDVIEIDSTSDVVVRVLRTRRGADQYQLSQLDRNIIIDSAYLTQIATDAPTGYSPITQAKWHCGQNLAVNGSFEAGNYGWTFSTSPTTTEEYITSEVGSGLMGHFVYAAAASHNHYQSINVPANMPVTITAKVKITAGSAGAFATIFSENLGVTQSNGYPRAVLNAGWQIISRTIIPTSAGALLVGLQYVNATTIYVDELSVSIGTVGVPYQAKWGSFELDSQTQTYDTAAPTIGTWKRGDLVWNATPSAGGTPGWMCVTAGSPGTWKAMANLAA